MCIRDSLGAAPYQQDGGLLPVQSGGGDALRLGHRQQDVEDAALALSLIHIWGAFVSNYRLIQIGHALDPVFFLKDRKQLIQVCHRCPLCSVQ